MPGVFARFLLLKILSQVLQFLINTWLNWINRTIRSARIMADELLKQERNLYPLLLLVFYEDHNGYMENLPTTFTLDGVICYQTVILSTKSIK